MRMAPLPLCKIDAYVRWRKKSQNFLVPFSTFYVPFSDQSSLTRSTLFEIVFDKSSVLLNAGPAIEEGAAIHFAAKGPTLRS